MHPWAILSIRLILKAKVSTVIAPLSISNCLLKLFKFCTESSHSEGMSIPGRHPIRSNDDSALAKSLPMRVPAMSNYRSQDIDIGDEKVIINHNTNKLHLVV